MSHPKVSMIIISYNQQDFIEEAMVSAIEQDYSNKEIIICDDGSTDNTAEIIKKVASNFPNENIVLSLSSKNLGITGNCNQAISLVSGDYVSFQGGDDVLLPGKVAAQVEYLQHNSEKAICFHDVDIFDSDSGSVMGKYSDRHPIREGDIKELILFGCFFCATSVMLRTSLMPKEGFNSSIPKASDWMFWCDVAINAENDLKTIGYCSGTFAKYRRHSANVTNKATLASVKEMLTCFDLLQVKCPELLNEVKTAKAKRLIVYSLKFLQQRSIKNFGFLIKVLLDNYKYIWPAFLNFFKERSLLKSKVEPKI